VAAATQRAGELTKLKARWAALEGEELVKLNAALQQAGLLAVMIGAAK
jgi:hypothetical protein